MPTRIERELRLLRAHAVFSTAAIGVLLLGAFRQAAPPAAAPSSQKVKFDEIDVQRINVVEPDGKLRMVISNAARSQGPLYRGKPFFYTGAERPRTGIIFFSEEEPEVGGLIYSVRHLGDTGYAALGHLSFDQFNQDQVIALQYVDRNGKRRMGIQFNDRHDTNIFDWANRRDSLRKLSDSPAKTEALRRLQEGGPNDPRVAERVYVGRDTLKNAILKLSDRLGKPRVRLLVDSLGYARLEFLDADGRVTHRVPEADGRGNR
jgi:hypothetical protein